MRGVGGGLLTVDRLAENSDASPEAVEALRNSDVVKQLARERTRANMAAGPEFGGVNRDVSVLTQTVGRGGLPALDNVAEMYRAREIAMQPPVLRGGTSTDATHFSHQRREVLDPRQQFTSGTRLQNGIAHAIPSRHIST